MDEETKNNLARMKASTDQAKGATRELASMLGVFRDELMKAGFDRGEALALCLTQLQILLSQGSGE